MTISTSSTMSGTGPITDIGLEIDDGSWSRLQVFVVVLAATSIIMDGFDGQLIGYAIPSIMRDWGLGRGAFSGAVAAGLVGMGIGSAVAGLLADRLGRRGIMVASVLTFGLATSLVGFSTNLTILAALRFLAGLGIGGALPSCTTMTAEFTPARLRTQAITATIVCVPAGGMLAGLFAAAVLPWGGWRWLFWLGGMIPIGLAAILWLLLPESPRYLARHPRRWPELVALLRRMGRAPFENAVFVDTHEPKGTARPTLKALFADGLAKDTLCLWAACFLALLANYSAFVWLPALMVQEGAGEAVARSMLTVYNLGGVIGALICSVFIARFGSRWPLGILCFGGAASGFALAVIDPLSPPIVLIGAIGFHGMFVVSSQCMMYSLFAHLYPTPIRATGTAMALTIGRLGTILSAFAGPLVMSGGAPAYFSMLATAMIGVLVALQIYQHHTPSVTRARSG